MSMKIIKSQSFDAERAFYGQSNLLIEECSFTGPADGESAFKECRNITAENCHFYLRYPFWHDDGLEIKNCKMYDTCRAPLWYSEHIHICDTLMHGVKALRECSDVRIENCDIISPEFGWSVDGISVSNCKAEGEYMFMRSNDMHFENFEMKGKYSFQYIEDAYFENCNFDTKDAFWHAKNVYVKNSTVKGEYLAWYCENVTFENCVIIGTQPLCYCKGLRLINCEMIDADFAFEKSEVEAGITTPVISIKNPLCGTITLPKACEIIRDEEWSVGKIIISQENI